MIYIPKEIFTMICNYCGPTIEQRQHRLWKSIIPNRRICGTDVITYYFTNKYLLDGLCWEWMKPHHGRSILGGAIRTRRWTV